MWRVVFVAWEVACVAFAVVCVLNLMALSLWFRESHRRGPVSGPEWADGWFAWHERSQNIGRVWWLVFVPETWRVLGVRWPRIRSRPDA